MRFLLVAAAGAVGAVVRYSIGLLAGGTSFPWVTLAINLLGSALLGAVVAAAMTRGLSPAATAALGAGFLGAFTTFSAFSVETLALARDGRPATALLYVAASTIGGVAAAALGYILTHRP